MPECITTLMLLANSSIEDAQRISVFAAAAPKDPEHVPQSSNDQYLAAVTYQSMNL